MAFDLDGTLVDLERFHHNALLRAAREAARVELSWDEARQRLPHFIGGPDARVAHEVAALSPAGVAPGAVLAAKRRYFAALIGAVEIVPRAGAGEVVDRLAARGVPVAVGTVTERGTAVGILRRAGLLPAFGEDRVVAAEDVPRLKPAPDVYRETARRLGVPPTGQLVFEDSITGMTAARAAGSPVVAMPTVHDRDYPASAVFTSWHDPGLLALLDGRLRHG